MSAPTNGTATASPEAADATPVDEFAQRAEYAENARKAIDARSWRRAFVAAMLALCLSLVANNALSWIARQPVVKVVRETPRGYSYDGVASDELTVSNNAIAGDLVRWVTAMKSVPGTDAEADKNWTHVQAMTANNPPDNALANATKFLSAEETGPKYLRTKLTRSIPDAGADALHDPGTNRWHLTWLEEEIPKNGTARTTLHHGVVDIAPEPHIPTDEEALLIDPSGTVVVNYDLH